MSLNNTKKLEENDPCWKERQQYYKCLNNNNFDNNDCAPQQINSKACRDFWANIQEMRRRKGIAPSMPGYEERKTIKEDYLRIKKDYLTAKKE